MTNLEELKKALDDCGIKNRIENHLMPIRVPGCNEFFRNHIEIYEGGGNLLSRAIFFFDGDGKCVGHAVYAR